MTTYLVMLGGEGVLALILSYGMPKHPSIWHFSASALAALAWFLLCLVYLG